MNFDRSLIFAYLEEDNIQRAYFRVKPLLTLNGDVQQEALQLWPNEGGLRIVPDRNEQHTFKLRMRKLGAFCVIDLRNQPAEAGKIRTNKNFRPERGEVNQYILYSDTVHELPEHTFYHLIDGTPSQFSELAQLAVTPLFYIREQDTIYGPLRKDAPSLPETAPDATAVLFSIACPDGTNRNILCMESTVENTAAVSPASTVNEASHQDAAPAAVSCKRENNDILSGSAPETLPIGENLQILDQHISHEETIKKLDMPVSTNANLLHENKASTVFQTSAPAKSEPLSGTPLVRTPLHISAPQVKNHMQEVVNNQWSVGKYEPPAVNLPAGTSMQSVQNPVETACGSFRKAWSASGSREKLAEFLLSLDGMRPQLEKKICADQSDTILQRVLRQRLQDLEAERLTALCELDRARRDTDAYRQEVTRSVSKLLAKETKDLEADREKASTQLDDMKRALNALTVQRDALQARVDELRQHHLPEAAAKLAAEAQMTMPFNGVPLRITPITGQHVTPQAIFACIQTACTDSGVDIDINTPIAIAVLLAVSPRIGTACSTTAALSTLLRNIMKALGWENSYEHQYSAEQYPLVGSRPIDSTPAVLSTSLPNYAPLKGAVKITINRNPSNLIRNAAYDVCQWPIFNIPALPFVPEIDRTPAVVVSESSIASLLDKAGATDAELNAILSPVLSAALPLSGAALKEMYRFISVCAQFMEGGLPSAADWGILLWLIPAIERGTKQHDAVKALLDEFPLSQSKL